MFYSANSMVVLVFLVLGSKFRSIPPDCYSLNKCVTQHSYKVVLMVEAGSEGLSCNSCGDECTQSCGTRHFRYRRFNSYNLIYLKWYIFIFLYKKKFPTQEHAVLTTSASGPTPRSRSTPTPEIIPNRHNIPTNVSIRPNCDRFRPAKWPDRSRSLANCNGSCSPKYRPSSTFNSPNRVASTVYCSTTTIEIVRRKRSHR